MRTINTITVRIKLDGIIHKVRHSTTKKGKQVLVLEDKYLGNHIKVQIDQEIEEVGQPYKGYRFTSSHPEKTECIVVLDEE